MQKQSPCKETAKEDFITLPADYDVDELSPELSLRLWRRSVADIAFQIAKGDFAHSGSFLAIHAFLKDPIHGLFKFSSQRLRVFHRLLNSVQGMLNGTIISTAGWQSLIAQASQESALLTIPYLEDTAYLRF